MGMKIYNQWMPGLSICRIKLFLPALDSAESGIATALILSVKKVKPQRNLQGFTFQTMI
jgi:hypothetical protein